MHLVNGAEISNASSVARLRHAIEISPLTKM